MRRKSRPENATETKKARGGVREWLKKHKRISTFIAIALLSLGSCKVEIDNRTYRTLPEATPCDSTEHPWTYSFPDLDDRLNIAENLAFMQVFARQEISTPANNQVLNYWNVEFNEDKTTMVVTFTNVYPFDYGADGIRVKLGDTVNISGPENVLGFLTKQAKLKINDHPYDFEPVFIKLEKQGDTTNWRVVKVIFNRHGKYFTYNLKVMSDQQKSGLTCVFGKQMVYLVAVNKHTGYANLEECNEAPLLTLDSIPIIESIKIERNTCSIGSQYPMVILPERDVGTYAVEGQLPPRSRLMPVFFGQPEKDGTVGILIDFWSKCVIGRIIDPDCATNSPYKISRYFLAEDSAR